MAIPYTAEQQDQLNEIEARLKVAQTAVKGLENELHLWKTAPENNVFADMDEAWGELEESCLEEARNDCEGAYNFGSDRYVRYCLIEGESYVMVVDVEYNRHDKTYYYVDGHTSNLYTEKQYLEKYPPAEKAAPAAPAA